MFDIGYFHQNILHYIYKTKEKKLLFKSSLKQLK